MGVNFAQINKVKFKIAEVLLSEVKQIWPNSSFDTNGLASLLAPTPNLDLGHIAFPTFSLAKQTGEKPPEIAHKLKTNWKDKSLIKDVAVAGPYINFFLDPESLAKIFLDDINATIFFKLQMINEKPFLVEYSQPNTHKELHVGHMRNICLGQALIGALKYSGYNVIACTFPGDVGTHVAKCLWYMRYHNKENPPALGKGEWLGKMYSLAHNLLEDQRGSEQEERNREQLTQILHQLEKKSGEFYDLWKETRQWSIDLMNEVYAWSGVKFDKWYWESDVDSDSVRLVKRLQSEGKLQTSEGAIGYDLTEEKLGFCMLLKSDGNGLYATKDLELARRKFSEFQPQKSILVVDMRQELHFKQVFSVFEKVGLGKKDDCYHLKYNFVELPEGAMSSRKGNIIPLTSLINQMRNTIKDNYLNRYANDWSSEEIETTANIVAQGAIKYGMNKMDSNKKIVFDMNEWLRLDGESGPYIQYAHARIQSLIEKQGGNQRVKPQWNKLGHKLELALMLQLSQFNEVVVNSAKDFKTSSICSYLYDLAKTFNHFYQECPIGKLDDEMLKLDRISLAKAVGLTIKQGLEILGIKAPQKM